MSISFGFCLTGHICLSSTEQGTRKAMLTAVNGDFIFCSPLNVFFSETHEHFRFLIADSFDLTRRDQDFFARIPVSGFNDQIANRPTLFIDHEISDVADISVACFDVITVNGLSAAEMFVFPMFMFLVGL